MNPMKRPSLLHSKQLSQLEPPGGGTLATLDKGKLGAEI